MIKKVLKIGVLMLWILGGGSFVASNKSSIVVKIPNVRNANGKIALQLLDGNQKVIQQLFVAAQKGEVQHVFQNLSAGFYAVQLYHDENENQKIDYGFFGAPTEGYGFSNNAKGFMSAPKFNAQLFEVKKQAYQSIRLIY